MLLSCGASPVGPDEDMTFADMMSMYIVFWLLAAMPLGRFTQTTVFDTVLLGLDSTHACSVVPGDPATALPV